VVQAGVDAWTRLKKDRAWADWVTVGEALLVGQAEAMRSAHTNRPEGRRYDHELADWLRHSGFDGLDKGTRSRLLACLANREAIETWRQSLPPSDRLRLNHPKSVLARWRQATTKKPEAKGPSPIAKLKEENARMRHEIERGGGDLWAAT